MRISIYITAFFTLIIIGLLLWYNKQDMNEKVLLAERTIERIPVHVERVEMKTLDRYYETAGLLSAKTETVVLAQTEGAVESVSVHIGVEVREGDVLARVSSDLNEEQVAVSRAAYEKAAKDLERARRLAEGNAITAQQLEALELQAESAEIKLKGALKKLSNKAVTAPFDGVVNRVFVKQGGLLGPGSPVCELVDIAVLEMEVQVPEMYILSVGEGDTAAVEVDVLPGGDLFASVTGVARKADRSSMYAVQLTLDQNAHMSLRAGMFARAVFRFEDTRPGPVLERRTLTGSLKNPEVFLVKDSTAYRTPVSVEFKYGDRVKIRSGLREGDLVVTSGQYNLDDGSGVKVIDR